MAIAVCGCGHDGRLGLGNESNAAQFTLLHDFLPTVEGQPAPHGTICGVSTGAYHTIAWTERGLYGWGINEDGQLGILRESAAQNVCAAAMLPHHPVLRPTRLSFFDFLEWEATNESGTPTDALLPAAKERFLSVACGARHSFVMTTRGLYACGCNAYGQLGVGVETTNLFRWTRVCDVSGLGDAVLLSNSNGTFHLCGGTLTHVRCGTHHTLLAWKDAVVTQQPSAHGWKGEASTETVCKYYPALILAAGKGDFGELGYDADLWSVLRSKDQRVHAAALQGATLLERYGNSSPSESTALTDTSAFSRWAAKHRKVRRPEFFSTSFQPAVVPQLQRSAVPLADGALRLMQAVGDAAAGAWVQSAVREAVAQHEHSLTRWVIDELQAMHLHSSVRMHTTGGPSAPASTASLHWGCYYCQEVEDTASSIPRPVRALGNYEKHDAVGVEDVHAGAEILIRYGSRVVSSNGNTRRDTPSATVEVCGSGCLGLGDDDSFEPDFVPVPILSGDVVRVCGRTHFLVLSTGPNTSSEGGDDDAKRCLYGFGDNLHGQLTDCGGTGDIVTAPVCILQANDVLHAAPAAGRSDWVVERIEDVGAGARHSVALVRVRRCLQESYSQMPEAANVWRSFTVMPPPAAANGESLNTADSLVCVPLPPSTT